MTEDNKLASASSLHLTDEVTDRTIGDVSNIPVSSPEKKTQDDEEEEEEDDPELIELRDQMKATNKEWEETFEKSEKQRLTQEIKQKQKEITLFHDGGTQYEPACKPKLSVKGQERQAIHDLLESKSKAMEIPIKPKHIEFFVKNVVVRENLKDQSKLDQRLTISLDILVQFGILRSREDSPTKRMQENMNKPLTQGQERFDRFLMRQYHTEQKELLQLLKEESILELPVNAYLDESKGFIRRGTLIVTTGEFCNILDRCTLKFSQNESLCENEKLIKVFLNCFRIVALRCIMDMLKENNLLHDKGHKTWMSHLQIVASFGVLCCVTLSQLIKNKTLKI